MTREEAIEMLNKWGVLLPSEAHEACDMAIEALSDAVEIVQCKDCKWYDNRYGDVCHNPRYGDGHANYQPPYVDEDYWCKDGERKGGQ